MRRNILRELHNLDSPVSRWSGRARCVWSQFWRFAAFDDFMVSAYSCGFMSNAFCGNPFGILLDAPGMTAYAGTWAALVKVKPTRRSYLMAGVYNGDTTIRANKYHGVNLTLNGPAFGISEAGYQINGLPGDSQLLGNYKLGGWYD